MELIIRHIEYLLSRNDCVIIPGFGAILAQKQSSHLLTDEHLIMPPHRTFSFNRSLSSSNDGKLAYSIVRREGISYAMATMQVKQAVDNMQRMLSADGCLNLGRVGLFTYDSANDTISFQPSDADLISIDTCGLPKVRQRLEIDESSKQNDGNVMPFRTSPFVRFVKAAASIALLIAFCFIASTPIAIDDAALASLMPNITKATQESLMPAGISEGIDAYVDSDIQSTYCELFDEPSAVTENQEEYIDSDIQDTYSQIPAYEEWVIVIGSSRLESDAIEYISQRPGQGLQYYQKNGNYRVYAASYPTEHEAYQACVNGGYSATQAWVTKK